MAFDVRRTFRHLFARSARALFPDASLQRVAAAIAAGEAKHRGQVCFAVDSALPLGRVLVGQQARHRAEDVFARLRVWDTEANNGVLVYLLIADHRIEIVADRGLAGRVAAEQWREICAAMEAHLKAGAAEAAALTGVEAVSALLSRHFPRAAGDETRNELPDQPRILG